MARVARKEAAVGRVKHMRRMETQSETFTDASDIQSGLDQSGHDMFDAMLIDVMGGLKTCQPKLAEHKLHAACGFIAENSDSVWEV